VAPAPASPANKLLLGNRLVGSWAVTREDREGDRVHTETTLIHFDAQGRYRTEIRSSLLPQPAGRGISGRYKASPASENDFTLTIDRDLDDPLIDRKLASESQLMKWLDLDSFRSADGDIARRVR
jgi:hypothetical protein